MARVYQKNEPVFGLERRVSRLGRRLEGPVHRFLEQPGAEALACFQKIFNSFAESPFLGLSALVGIVGLFAYAKALLELEKAHLYIGSLMSASDVTTFAIRLGVPFVLLALASAAVVFGFVTILTRHRRGTGSYWAFTIVALILCTAFLLLYVTWVQVGRSELGLLFAGWFIVWSSLVIMAAWLYRADRKPGIKGADRLQRGLLRALHVIAQPGALLLAIIAIGLYLTAFNGSSILLDPAAGQWLPSAQNVQPEASCASRLLVVAVKSLDQPIIAARITELGSMVAVQKVDRGVCSEAPQPNEKSWPDPDQGRWLVFRPEEVTCVRRYDPSKKNAGCAPVGTSQPLPESPAPSVPGRSLSKLSPVPQSAANVARYAQRFLNCDPAPFQRRDALIFNFDAGHPGKSPGMRTWKHAFRTVSMAALEAPDLDGVRGSEGDKEDLVDFLRGAGSPHERLWVLGFASVSGRSSLNEDLSENRARVVLDYLRHSYREFSGRNLGGRYRGLGANLFSGLGNTQQDAGEQIAVAFFCRD